VAGIGHVASWSEVESQGGSSSRRKEEMTAARNSLPNSCVVVVPQRQRDLPQYDGPDLSGVPLLFSVPPLPPLSSAPLLPLLVSLFPPPLSVSQPPSPLSLLSALPVVVPLPPRALPLLPLFILRAPAHTFHRRNLTSEQ